MSFQSLTEKITTLVGSDSGLDASIKFVTEDGVILVDAKQVPNVVSTQNGEADCTFDISTADALALLSGELHPMTAFMSGQLKIEGDMAVAMKIAQTFSA